MDDRPGENPAPSHLEHWGWALGLMGAAIVFVMLVVVPLLIWFFLWFATSGSSTPAGD